MASELRLRRQRLGLTATALARIVGCSRQSVALAEAGYRPAHSGMVHRIEEALDMLEIVSRDLPAEDPLDALEHRIGEIRRDGRR